MLLLQIALLVLLFPVSALHDKFERELVQIWTKDPSVRANVLLRIQDHGGRKRLLATKRTSRERWKRLQSVVAVLKLHAHVSQKTLLKTLQQHPSQHGRVTQLWISNTLSIENATIALITELAAFSSVRAVSLDIRIPFQQDEEDLDELRISKSGNIATSSSHVRSTKYWGLERTRINQAHKRLSHRGEGVIIGIVDTGLSIYHQVFNRSNLVKWHDAAEIDENEPYDDDSHGTHVAAQLVGRDGVAPGAQYVVCNAFDGIGTTERLLTACSQFMLCPDEDKCQLTPQVINNSWNLNREEAERMDPIVDAWEIENIIPVASSGNRFRKAQCGNLYLMSPATFPNVISVGALTHTNRLAYFSRQAIHSGYGLDLVAPGHAIASAHARILDDTIARNGTSVAAPFVTGTIALLLAEAKRGNYSRITFEDIHEVLTHTACKQVEKPEIECGPFHTGYGYGVLNADAALTYFREQFQL